MKKFTLSILISSSLAFGVEINLLESFQANFTQEIIDDHNKSIKYNGELYAKKPSLALWKYISPIEKSVYLRNFIITIVEPELEQAIIKHVSKDIDLFNIISKAKKIDNENYIAEYSSQKYDIKLKDSVLSFISYKDSLIIK